MKSLQVIAGMCLWLFAAGCAQDGPLRRLVQSDRSPAVTSFATNAAPKKANNVTNPFEHEVALATDVPVRFEKPSVVEVHPGEDDGPDASLPNRAHQVRTGTFQGKDELPQPRKLDLGKPITLTLDEVEVRKAFELLGKEGALNILVSPAVSGKISISLKGVTLEQAFDALLKSANLISRRDQGIIYIYTPEEFARLGDDKLPIRMYRLNYIRSVDLEKMIKPFLSPKGKLTTSPSSAVGIESTSAGSSGSPAGGGAATPGGGVPGGGGGAAPGGGSGGSATGGDSLASGEVVIIQDREEILKTIEPLVAQLDVQPSQVLIEVVIMQVKLEKGKEFGINFAVVNSAGKVLSVVGNGALLNTAVGFTPATLVNAGGLVKGTSGSGFAKDQYGGSFGFSSNNIQGFLRAVETLGKTEVLASPRLLVLNKQLAEFQLGDRLGYATLTSQTQVSSTSQVQFLDIGTQLRVRPFISSDGMVRMEIHPERSSGSLDPVTQIPQTNTTQLTTNVMVPDGATIVIGGLIENFSRKDQNGIPYLSNLPWVGALFRERFQTNTKTELIVLLTPRIWNPNTGVMNMGPAPAGTIPAVPNQKLLTPPSSK